jgi:hypothetical protein
MEVDGEVEVEADLPTSSTILPATTTTNGNNLSVPLRVILPTSCECLII